jgi:hypothetical protein
LPRVIAYHDGVQLPDLFSAKSVQEDFFLEFSASPALLYCGSSNVFSRLAVGSTGLTLLDSTTNTLISGSDRNLEFDGGRVFTTGGRIFDPEAKTNIASVPYSGLVAPDSGSGKVFYLTGSASTYNLVCLNFTNLQLAGSIAITNVSGTPASLIRWGVDGLAFRTTGGQIFLLRTTLADDRDQDGLADTWELAHFGSLANSATDDPDHDGFTNLQEQQAGFDPLVFDALRFLYGRPASGGGFEMAVIGNPGVIHTLSVSSNLVDWVPLFNFTCTNQPTMIVDPSPPSGERYYRLTRGSEN